MTGATMGSRRSQGELRIEFDGVGKTFRKDDGGRSLRDLWAGAAARLRGQAPPPLRPEFQALKDVSFQVRAGECVGVIGHNGAGKSTVLKCASRIFRPNAGTLNVKGRVSALIEVGAGFHPDLTGRENVFLNGSILGMRRREIAARFDEIVEFSGLAAFIDTPVKRYSSGMFARLGFAVAAFMEPDVLLIDEVLSVGDLAFARKCERKIMEIVGGDTAVLFVSHNLAAVRMICERVIVMQAGRVAFDGPAGDAIHRYHEILAEESGEGSAHAAVRRLRFTLDGDGPAATVEPGGTVTLDAELIAAERIADATMGFSVLDERGQELFEARTDDLGVPPTDLAPGAALRARFKFAANLLPGVYWIGSSVRGRTGDMVGDPAVLELTPNRLQLAVAGASEGRGSANLFAACAAEIAAGRPRAVGIG